MARNEKNSAEESRHDSDNELDEIVDSLIGEDNVKDQQNEILNELSEIKKLLFFFY